MTQQPLTFLRPSKPESRVGELIQALDGRGWRSGKILARVLQTDDRTIRAIANASKGAVIGTNRGYILTRSATVDDCNEAEGRLLNQIKHMAQRVRDIRNARNRRSA